MSARRLLNLTKFTLAEVLRLFLPSLDVLQSIIQNLKVNGFGSIEVELICMSFSCLLVV